MDAGTSQTFQNVRRVNLFDTVIENLKRYREYSENIHLQYITLEENCGNEDTYNFIQYCKEIGILQILISRDVTKKWEYKKSVVLDILLMQHKMKN